jgi:transcriptional regulator GlxA family with amidase domain
MTRAQNGCMKHVSILVPEGDCSVTTIEGTHQILCRVNDYLDELGRPPAFNIHLVGLHSEIRMKAGLFTVCPDTLIRDLAHTDLIFVPSVHGNQYKILADNKDMLAWIVQQYHGGAAVATLCIGAFLLAGTGLLDGKKCTTHWELAGKFREMFPAARLSTDKIITEENNIYTSGGAYSWLNLILYLVEKYAGREIAVLCAKGFQIDIQRSSQSPFIIFSSQKDHKDTAIGAAQEFIEQNSHVRITAGQIAAMLSLGRRNLERRFKQATGNTLMEYIQRVKVEVVKKNLETSRLGVNEAIYKVGYSDPKAFRIVFKKVTGLSPLQYRNRFNQEFI